MAYAYKTWTEGDPLLATDLNKASAGVEDAIADKVPTLPAMSPVGAVVAWLKSLTNTPALPANWVECNGQTLSDAASVYNGVVIPNLNGSGSTTKRFLRGHTASGAVGGEDTHTLSEAELPAHSHVVPTCSSGNFGNQSGRPIQGDSALTNGNNPATQNTGSGSAHNNLPSYYEVVWVMRIK